MDTEEGTQDNRPLEERMKDCPIHRWADSNIDGGIKGYLFSCEVHPRLWDTFHELIIARGKYHTLIGVIDARKFKIEAFEIVRENDEIEIKELSIVFQDLIQLWIENHIRCQ